MVSVPDGTIDKDITNEVGTIEFKNVSFKYPDAEEYLLKDISFKVNKGENEMFFTFKDYSFVFNKNEQYILYQGKKLLINNVNK